MERETGLEPATSSLGSWHSTTELLPLTVKSAIYLNPLDFLDRGPSLFRPCYLSITTRLDAKMDSKTDSTAASESRISPFPCCPFMLSISLSKACSRHNIAHEFRAALMPRALANHSPRGAKTEEASHRGANQSRVRVHGTLQIFYQVWF